MKMISLLLLAGFITITGYAQNSGNKNSISLGLDLPFLDFSNTHSFGIGADYAWSNGRFGKMNTRPLKPIGFTFNAGVDHYFGNDITVGNVTYEFSDYTYIHTYGGILYNPCKNGNINLTAGPFLSLWNGGSEFGFGVNLGGSIGISENIAISPGIYLMKHSNSDPVYNGTLRATFSF